MIIYPKIDTLYTRDAEFKVTNKLRLPEFDLIKTWLITEKINGLNVRIMWNATDRTLTIRGRTNKPPSFIFTPPGVDFLIPDMFDTLPSLILFGGLCGPGIRNGNSYLRNPEFRLFDVLVLRSQDTPIWLNWSSVVMIALKLNILTVPVLGEMSLEKALKRVVNRRSEFADQQGSRYPIAQEGIVARTDPLLCLREGPLDNRGLSKRLMWTLKATDFNPNRKTKSYKEKLF